MKYQKFIKILTGNPDTLINLYVAPLTTQCLATIRHKKEIAVRSFSDTGLMVDNYDDCVC